ncbi:hypothetical protein HZA26_01035 [Candidatus Nomurabacteria bacterium]|nr:hypothetical protein [Candidatus Nomurabacteria bacterium]
MGKLFTKKAAERRKRPRAKVRTEENKHHCCFCDKVLLKKDKALFVEEELGRVFCSEECITAFFTPDVEELERQYTELLGNDDLVNLEKERLSHLRWQTLQEPTEVWREKTPAGDLRYTLISEFQSKNQAVWYICICLLLRGDPSFLFLGFPTKSPRLVDAYRKGESVKAASLGSHKQHSHNVQDRLADAWTEDETRRARFLQDRKKDDIPLDEFGLYDGCFDETLESPDEVWVIQKEERRSRKIYHFIRFYPNEQPMGVWFIIIAKETEDDDEIEILEAFPTRDASLVEYFRRGQQEVGIQDAPHTSRLVH